MSDHEYGWQIISDSTRDSKVLAVVDGDVEDALAYVRDDKRLCVGNQVKLIDGDTVEVDD